MLAQPREMGTACTESGGQACGALLYMRSKQQWFTPFSTLPTAILIPNLGLQETGEWRACVERSSLKYCVRHYHPQQLVKGMYSEFIMVNAAGHREGQGGGAGGGIG